MGQGVSDRDRSVFERSSHNLARRVIPQANEGHLRLCLRVCAGPMAC